MPDKFVSKIITPFGERLIKAAAVTDDVKNALKNIFIAEIGVTPYNDVLSAYNNDKTIIGKISENTAYGVNTSYYPLLEYVTDSDEGDYFFFGLATNGNLFTYWNLHILGGWGSKTTSHIVEIDDSLNNTSTNPVQNAVVFSAINSIAMKDNGSKTESDIVNGKFAIVGQNSTTKLTLTSVSTLTILSNVGIPNFAITIDNSANASDVSISVKTSDELTTLYHSTAGGTSIAAGSVVQITAVGDCWTLAEFTVPTP